MDDNQLDDAIRKKVAQFKGDEYDPASFSALRFKLESIGLPFHARYRTELITGSALAVVTVIVLLSQWMIASDTTEALNSKMKSQQELITKLQQEIRANVILPPDTIYIVSQDEKIYYQYLLTRIAKLEAELKAFRNEGEITQTKGDVNRNFLEQNGASDDYMPALQTPTFDRITVSANKKSKRAEPTQSENSNQVKKKLSTSTMRDIEKHYHPGIGIRLGPALELVRGNIKGGNGNLNTCAGILADFIVSPSFSLETGITYGHRDYSYDEPIDAEISLPGTDPALGNLKKAEIDSWMFEVPISLKYRYPFTMKTNALASVGYSSFIFREQAFDYSYEYDGNDDIFVNVNHESKALKFYPGTINLSLGLSQQIKNQRFEASIGYRKGIGPIGLEKTRADFFNIRTVYWITVK